MASLGNWISLLHAEFGYALRHVAARPAFSALVIGVLAVGLGAVLFMLAVINTVLWRPMPFAEPERLFQAGLVPADAKPDTQRFMPIRAGELLRWRAALEDMAEPAGFATTSVNMTDVGLPERHDAAWITASLFAVLGEKPQLGRALVTADELPGAAPVALLSDALWRQRFNADPTIVGRTLRIDARNVEVVGVMQPTVSFPRRAKLWLATPLAEHGQAAERELLVVLREHAGVAPGAVSQRLQGWFDDASAQAPQRMSERASAVGVLPLDTLFVDPASRSLLGFMLLAVCLVLLIACSNVANLMLGQIQSRQQELSLRLALGASRARLLLGVMLQVGVLSLIAAVLALVLTHFGLQAFASKLGEVAAGGPPLWWDWSITPGLIVAALAASFLTAALGGGVPALRSILKRDSNLRAHAAAGSFNSLGKLLVAGQVAFSLVLLLATAVMLQTLHALDTTELGLDTDRILTARVSLANPGVHGAYDPAPYQTSLLHAISAQPQVQDVAISSGLPGVGGAFIGVLEQGVERPVRGPPSAIYAAVSTDFLSMMGARLEQGRWFVSSDRADSAPVVVVDQTFVEQRLCGGPALGKQIELFAGDSTRIATIVGVLAAVQLDDLERDPDPSVFAPFVQDPQRNFYVVVRSIGEPMALMAGVREAAASVDADTPLYWIRDYDRALNEVSYASRMLVRMFTLFGALALVLAASGLYGVMAYSVSRRIREFGVRRALGARNPAVIRDVLSSNAIHLGVGLALGLLLGVPFAQMLASTAGVAGVSPLLTVLPALLVLGMAAALASWLPARRALAVEPAEALRHD
ncbi:MAG: ABC transporter permease [Pseudomarimonas sp.]